MAVGPHDLSGGLDILNTSVLAGSPWISANIITHDNKPIFPPWIIKQIDTGKVGIIGLTAPETISDEYRFADWQHVLPIYIEQLLLECDFIVLLSNLEDEQNESIAKRFPQIHLIISADQKKGNQPPRIIYNTLIAQTHTRGKYLGLIHVEWSKIKIWQSVRDLSGVIRDQLTSLQERSDELKNSTIQAEIERQQMLAEQKRSLKLFQQDNSSELTGTYSFRFLPLSEQVPELDEIERKVLEAKREISKLNKHTNRDSADNISTKTNSDAVENRIFAGPENCAPCHNDQVSRWRQTAHADSMASLKREMQQYNIRCLTCHVTQKITSDGLPEVSMHLLSLPDKLRMVGCESCHGPALVHSENPEQTPALSATEETCRNCHTAEMDPAFNFLEKMKQISCAEKRE